MNKIEELIYIWPDHLKNNEKFKIMIHPGIIKINNKKKRSFNLTIFGNGTENDFKNILKDFLNNHQIDSENKNIVFIQTEIKNDEFRSIYRHIFLEYGWNESQTHDDTYFKRGIKLKLDII